MAVQNKVVDTNSTDSKYSAKDCVRVISAINMYLTERFAKQIRLYQNGKLSDVEMSKGYKVDIKTISSITDLKECDIRHIVLDYKASKFRLAVNVNLWLRVNDIKCLYV